MSSGASALGSNPGSRYTGVQAESLTPPAPQFPTYNIWIIVFTSGLLRMGNIYKYLI